MSHFLGLVLLVTALAHGPFVAFAAESFDRLGIPAPPFVPWLLPIPLVAFFVLRARIGAPDVRRSPVLIYLLDLPYFVHWCACMWGLIPLMLGALLFLAARALGWTPPTSPRTALAALYLAGVASSMWGIFIRRRWVRVRELDVPIDGLDARLEGLRIAQLSDLHIGSLTPLSWGLRWADLTNRQRPDLIAVTGDLVTSGSEFHEDISRVVAQLRAKHGVFVVLGNHDYFGDAEGLVQKLDRTGARVLRNQGEVVSRDGAALFVAGIDDTWTKRDDLEKALSTRPADMDVVLLAHDPERFRDAAKRDVALVLAGHTHAGQIAVPFLERHLSLSHLTHHFHVGLYRKRRSVLYVNPGLGTTGPPMRFGVAPEITVLTLRRPTLPEGATA